MPLVSDSIPNLINGVSQQPSSQRRPSQCELQENCVSDIVNGLSKRPPTEHIAKLSSTAFGNVFTKTIIRDSSERYKVIISDGNLRVFDVADGTESTVTFPDGKAYLSASNPRQDFAITTIADFSFIANKNVVVAKDPTIPIAERYEGLVHIKQARAAVTYKVFVNGSQVASHTTSELSTSANVSGSNTTTTNQNTPSTDTIASALASQLTSNLSGYTITNKASTIVITHPSTDFTLRCEDSYGNNASKGIKETAQKLADLPAFATDGFTVQIIGAEESDADNHYLKYVSDAGSNGSGIWKETYKPGLEVDFDYSTMPHKLEKQSDGTWIFGEIDWESRTVGDDDSSPFPSFTGLKINDIYTYRARLGILADENEILSEVNEHFNFFPKTVTTLLDSDRIDVTGTDGGDGVTILKHAIALNKHLTIFSDKVQFSQSGENLLTPSTVDLPASTTFEVNNNARPVPLGKNIYFNYNLTDFSGIQEYFVTQNTDDNDAANITSHVPKYLPSNIFKLAGSTTVDMLCALSSDTPNIIYTYQFFWSGNEKLQSSWHSWVFPEDDHILNLDFVEDWRVNSLEDRFLQNPCIIIHSLKFAW